MNLNVEIPRLNFNIDAILKEKRGNTKIDSEYNWSAKTWICNNVELIVISNTNSCRTKLKQQKITKLKPNLIIKLKQMGRGPQLSSEHP